MTTTRKTSRPAYVAGIGLPPLPVRLRDSYVEPGSPPYAPRWPTPALPWDAVESAFLQALLPMAPGGNDAPPGRHRIPIVHVETRRLRLSGGSGMLH